MEESTEQLNNSRPWLYKKGQSGNPSGRPKGSKSMKQWVKEKLESMTDEEREVFMEGLPKEIIWKMAEGSPQTNTDITTGGVPLILPATLINKNDTPHDPGTSSTGQTPL